MNTEILERNTSGYRGVTWNKLRGKWQAQAMLDGRNNYLGLFDLAEDASKAYQAFCQENHGLFFAKDQMVARAGAGKS